jgi:nucleoid-associated protein YgaU
VTDRSSRHADLATYRRTVPGRDGEVELYEPRFRTEPPAAVTHTARRTDRLDLLADRYLEDPHQFWRIADANPDAGLEELVEPGRTVKIPRRPS